jgi:hypothetical protein
MIQILLVVVFWLAFKWLLLDEDGSEPPCGCKSVVAPGSREIGTFSCPCPAHGRTARFEWNSRAAVPILHGLYMTINRDITEGK